MCMMKGYPYLCTSLKENNPASYEVGLYQAYTSELSNNMIVEKQYNTTDKGTNFLYKQIENEEEFDKYKNVLNEICKRINLDCDNELVQVLGIGECE